MGDFVIIDIGHPGNIDPPGRDIGGDQNGRLAGFEPLQRPVALSLAFVAMDGIRLEPGRDQVFHHPLAAVFCPAEYQGHLALMGGQAFLKKRQFFRLGQKMHRLGDPIRNLPHRRDLDPHGIIQIGLRNLFHLLGHCRGKQHRLSAAGHQRRDLAQGVDKAHIQHLIRLVEHQKPGLVQAHGLALQMINQPPGCRHQDIHPPAQPFGLHRHRLPADHKADAQMGLAGKGEQGIGNLACQFPCRRQDQRPRGLGRRAGPGGQQFLHDRQAKCRRFAGAGLGQPHDIAARQRLGDGPGLDRRGCGDILCFEHPQNLRGKAQGLKFFHGLRLSALRHAHGFCAGHARGFCARGLPASLQQGATCGPGDPVRVAAPLRDVGTNNA